MSLSYTYVITLFILVKIYFYLKFMELDWNKYLVEKLPFFISENNLLNIMHIKDLVYLLIYIQRILYFIHSLFIV